MQEICKIGRVVVFHELSMTAVAAERLRFLVRPKQAKWNSEARAVMPRAVGRIRSDSMSFIWYSERTYCIVSFETWFQNQRKDA